MAVLENYAYELLTAVSSVSKVMRGVNFFLNYDARWKLSTLREYATKIDTITRTRSRKGKIGEKNIYATEKFSKNFLKNCNRSSLISNIRNRDFESSTSG